MLPCLIGIYIYIGIFPIYRYFIVNTHYFVENGPFIDDFPIKTSIYFWDFPWLALLVITRWSSSIAG